MGGGPCDYCVTPVPIGLGFGFRTASVLGLGLKGPDLGLGLDNIHSFSAKVLMICIVSSGAEYIS